MKKFGFGKKGDGDEDSNRSALFSRSSKSSPAPAASNPYAQPPPAADPYAQDTNKYANMGPAATPYQQARQQYGLPSGPGAARGGRGGLPGGPAAGRGPPSSGPPPPGPNRQPPNGGGYGSEKYGSGGGYGSNRYDTQPSYGGPPADTGSRYGPGGYGGLGRRNSNETTTTEDNREALFGGAKDRYAQRGPMPPQNGQPGGGYASESGTSGGAGGASGGYGEERQLTAEEEEEEDISSTKQQIRFIKQEDVSSTRNALRLAAEAEETGRATLARLGAQGERIHNTEKNLDIAANHNRIAEEKSKELKTLNRSMFAVHVSNPFTASSRRAARDEEIIEKHRVDRDLREGTRASAFASQQRMERSFKDLQPGDPGYRPQHTKASLAERSRFQFEADSEDEDMENEIDANLEQLGNAAGRLNALARATGTEVEEQNKLLDRVTVKTNNVDDQIVMNRARLDRIR